MASVIPKQVKKVITDGWAAETWKCALFTNAYTYADTHSTYALAAAAGGEVVGTGYTIAGKAMAGLVSAYDTSNATIDATDTVWTSPSTFTARYAIVYETTGGLIRAIYDFGADKTVTTGTFTIVWNAGGLVKISS